MVVISRTLIKSDSYPPNPSCHTMLSLLNTSSHVAAPPCMMTCKFAAALGASSLSHLHNTVAIASPLPFASKTHHADASSLCTHARQHPHTNTNTNTHKHKHAQTHPHTNTNMHTHIHTYTHAHNCTHAHTHTHTHTHTQLRTYTQMHTCAHAYMYTFARLRVPQSTSHLQICLAKVMCFPRG